LPLGVIILLIAFVLHDRVVSSVIYEQRQHHLAAAVAQPKKSIGHGDALGYLQIPKIGLDVTMVEGVDVDSLRSGPAHQAGTALPGDVGAMVIFGHRSSYGGPFRRAVELTQGDEIVAQTRNGGPIVKYVVDRVERHTRLADVTLDKLDEISYAVLVTAESGLLDGDVVVVVARALPVTDAPVSAIEFGTEPDRGFPVGFELLLGNASAVGAVLAWRYMRSRVSTGLRWIVVTPMVSVAVLALLGAVESVAPLVR
jgi:LPXTG-site transpeptidase (sortase) family protein